MHTNNITRRIFDRLKKKKKPDDFFKSNFGFFSIISGKILIGGFLPGQKQQTTREQQNIQSRAWTFYYITNVIVITVVSSGVIITPRIIVITIISRVILYTTLYFRQLCAAIQSSSRNEAVLMNGYVRVSVHLSLCISPSTVEKYLFC